MAIRKAPTIGALIDQMDTLKTQRAALAKQDDALKAEYDAAELQLILALDAQATTKGASATRSASIKFSDIYSAPNEGWNIFMEKVVAKHKLWHLVQRRLSNPSVEEYVNLKGLDEKQMAQLGIVKFTKRSISLTKL